MDICVFGAGSIGCYVGGRLAATGSRVTFVGRPRLKAELRQHGLHLTDWQGADLRVPAANLRFETDPAATCDADLVLVSVKSAGTEGAGRELARVLKPGACVISFQNGLHNAEVLRAQLPRARSITVPKAGWRSRRIATSPHSCPPSPRPGCPCVNTRTCSACSGPSCC